MVYVFPFITLKQYNELMRMDRKLKVKDFPKWSRLKMEAEHRLEFGCQVCGWKGTRARR